MAYSPDFWVVVATAAPIIALANTVTLTESIRLQGEYWAKMVGLDLIADAPIPYAEHAVRYIARAFVNYLGQTVAFIVALLSLAWERNAVPIGVPIGLETLGMVIILGFAFAEGVAKQGIYVNSVVKQALERKRSIRDYEGQGLLGNVGEAADLIDSPPPDDSSDGDRG